MHGYYYYYGDVPRRTTVPGGLNCRYWTLHHGLVNSVRIDQHLPVPSSCPTSGLQGSLYTTGYPLFTRIEQRCTEVYSRFRPAGVGVYGRSSTNCTEWSI